MQTVLEKVLVSLFVLKTNKVFRKDKIILKVGIILETTWNKYGNSHLEAFHTQKFRNFKKFSRNLPISTGVTLDEIGVSSYKWNKKYLGVDNE